MSMMTDIDRAVNAAKARRAAKAGEGIEAEASEGTEGTEGSGEGVSKEKASGRKRLTDEERAKRKEALEADRAERKEKREAERSAKKAAKEADKKTPHMSKVDKAAERLPSMASGTQSLFNEAIANLPASEVSALAAHLQHFNRVKATERALNQKVVVGDTVRIIGGDPRYIGKVGTIEKAQRIRCYVEVPGTKKSVYLFTSDVALVEEDAEEISDEQPTGTDG